MLHFLFFLFLVKIGMHLNSVKHRLITIRNVCIHTEIRGVGRALVVFIHASKLLASFARQSVSWLYSLLTSRFILHQAFAIARCIQELKK